MPLTVCASIPALSPSVIASEITSRQPIITELPMSFREGAAAERYHHKSTILTYLFGNKHTFSDTASDIDIFSSHRGDKKIGELRLYPLVTSHYYH